MTKNELNCYATRISQASKTQIIVIMYEVAIKYIEDGIKALEAGDEKEYRHCITRAKAFVNELASVLDMKYKISHELLPIYTYICKALVKADIRLDASELTRIAKILSSLKEAFLQVSREDTSGQVMKNAPKIYSGLTYSKDSLNDNYEYTYEGTRGYMA